MSTELEDLEKKFILDEDKQHEDIEKSIKHMLRYCQTDKNGYVVIDAALARKLTIFNRILVVLAARHLARALQTKLGRTEVIQEEITAKELADMLKEKPSVIAARLKELKDQKKAVTPTRGVFRIAPYAIGSVLQSLEGIENE